MTTDGWEQRLADLGQARELREAIASTLCTIEQQQNDMGGQFVLWEHAGSWRRERHLDQADALLSGPLAPLLDSQAAVERVEALHTPHRSAGPARRYCRACGVAAPCPTIAALANPT